VNTDRLDTLIADLVALLAQVREAGDTDGARDLAALVDEFKIVHARADYVLSRLGDPATDDDGD
jgi:hypothetical protein